MMHFLWPLLGSGPVWRERTQALLRPCYTSLWLNFLYISNWVSHHEDIVSALSATRAVHLISSSVLEAHVVPFL